MCSVVAAAIAAMRVLRVARIDHHVLSDPGRVSGDGAATLVGAPTTNTWVIDSWEAGR